MGRGAGAARDAHSPPARPRRRRTMARKFAAEVRSCFAVGITATAPCLIITNRAAENGKAIMRLADILVWLTRGNRPRRSGQVDPRARAVRERLYARHV
jgi:hypothetical protein